MAADTRPASAAAPNVKPSRPSGPRKPPANQIYALPVPIRTFPLPSFYPANPLSLVHLACAWLSQLVSPPREPAVVHRGVWSEETRSVHIVDPKSIRALWEQGFFGKGNYSRSEPNWLRLAQSKRGANRQFVAESNTAQRRHERKLMKWDRARKEQEAIERTRRLEAWKAPVGPVELLALPNSLQDLLGEPEIAVNGNGAATDKPQIRVVTDEPGQQTPNGNGAHDVQNGTDSVRGKKSVRFSPKVMSTTFMNSDPPSPGLSALTNGDSLSMLDGAFVGAKSETNTPAKADTEPASHTTITSTATATAEDDDDLPDLVDIEHLQLSPEEALYLSFGLGVLAVHDPTASSHHHQHHASGTPQTPHLAPRALLSLFRRNSYFPPRTQPLDSLLHPARPDDPFMLHYAAYHHFRSLGWIVRSGIKFGVDWLLYFRGPVFSHAEFAVVVLPAYTDAYWKTPEGAAARQDNSARGRTWHWLHGVNRVQATALKTLVLVYVDVPPPPAEEEGQDVDVASAMARYKVREFVLKRWQSNRNTM